MAPLVISVLTGLLATADLFDRSNLAAWCLVPFDAKKSSPEDRGVMVAKMRSPRIADDWRQQYGG
ncbi:MAG: hypothetical protein CMM01_06620 [Rhodopirellula sp.]|nr:hypothetical protein [Rhodopirellula sp.]OUX52023.1 MAG: hypothetical protein CBE43_01990 [Rhodopirellula sp. TMED283]